MFTKHKHINKFDVIISEDKGNLAFAMTTENSLTMKLGEVVKEVANDHAYMQVKAPNS
ncbi:MAG: DUF3783 domain-containing protein [Sphaerochaetaceae bacterium]